MKSAPAKQLNSSGRWAVIISARELTWSRRFQAAYLCSRPEAREREEGSGTDGCWGRGGPGQSRMERSGGAWWGACSIPGASCTLEGSGGDGVATKMGWGAGAQLIEVRRPVQKAKCCPILMSQVTSQTEVTPQLYFRFLFWLFCHYS